MQSKTQVISLLATVAFGLLLLLQPPSSELLPNSKQILRQRGSTVRSQVTTAKKCEAPVDIPKNYYKSQSKEDRRLMEWFGSLCGGTYLELGGLDGVTYSNSYVFNKALGWKGVLIELRHDNFKKLEANRPDEIARVHAGVCDKPQTLHAVYSDNKAVGGIYEFAAPTFKEQWWKGIDLDTDPRVETIECDELNTLLKKYASETTYFDFLSLDVEGAEFAVLESIDFDRTQFGIILVEADEHNQMKNMAMRQFLEMKGYRFLFEYERSYWFVNLDFNNIYQGLIYDV